MRLSIASTALLACALCAYGPSPAPASADTLPLVAGMQTNGNMVRCFEFHYFAEGAIGLTKTGQCIAHFISPVYWRTFPSGTRTVRVRGKRTGSDPWGCSLLVFDEDGFVVSQDFGHFTQGGYSWIDLDVTGVTSSTSAELACSPEVGSGYVLMMSWTP